MKRILSLLLALTLVFALVACSNEKDTSSDPDSSTPTTQTESTDTNDTQTSETDTDESSSVTETPSNSTPTTSTETSKPTTSNKDNTTSSKPTNTTSTPTTSNPTTSTPSNSTPTHTHSWSDWKTETKAFVGKDGTEKRTCSSCKETESRALTKDAAYNSFYDLELHWFMLDNIGISGGINSSNLITYFSQKYEGRDDATINPSSSTVFDWLSSRFTLTDSLKEKMKQDARYNKASDTFALSFEGNCGDAILLGYIHNGGSKYTVYYSFEAFGGGKTNYKVELEYKLLNGTPNKYLLVETVNSVPNNIIK